MPRIDLCNLPPEERIDACRQLLEGDQPAEERVETLYQMANTLYSQDRIGEALAAAEDGAVLAVQNIYGTAIHAARASCLLDFGRLDEAAGALADATRSPILESSKPRQKPQLEAHIMGLKARLLAAHGRNEAYDLFLEAAEIYRKAESTHGESWVMLEAAKVALRCGRTHDALICLELVSNSAYIPTAVLLRAEAMLCARQVGTVSSMIAEVLAGQHGAVKPHHRARAHYLYALRSHLAGETVRASVYIAQAMAELNREQRRDVELSGAIRNLRNELEKEVA